MLETHFLRFGFYEHTRHLHQLPIQEIQYLKQMKNMTA